MMGRVAECLCQWGSQQGQVMALLESTELLLRGDIRRRVPLADMRNVLASADGLHFVVDTEHVALALKAAEAASWARKIATPPPSLRHKLGLGTGAKALVLGPADTPALADALQNATSATPAQADMLIAVVANASELQAAMRTHASLPPGAPLWVIHGKGRGAPFGEAPVRTFMREAGFIDSKVTAVSAAQTATRYGKER